MASKSSASNPKPSLKQGKLSFASSKRTNSITPAVKNKPARPKLRNASSSSSSSNGTVNFEDVPLTPGEGAQPETKLEGRPTVTTASVQKADKTAPKTPKTSAVAPPSKAVQDETPLGKQGRPELRDDDPRWTRHYSLVQEKMNHAKPIHGEGQNKIHEILRVFDLSYEYGPCIGVSRLERWERANALGLSPPIAVHEILSTRQGAELSECVFNGEV